MTSSRLFSLISPWPKPRPSSSRALRTRGVGGDFAGAPTITAGRVITTPLELVETTRPLVGFADVPERSGVGVRGGLTCPEDGSRETPEDFSASALFALVARDESRPIGVGTPPDTPDEIRPGRPSPGGIG